ncbi:class I SAM-dependent methyltransferase [Aureimonas fodinaquatilis]|uniref:Class I SAM-dependent methyltransferase n=1 Tax=Aureimonas fodinaquatilis TaxID=2565783 RepID=A0A5B0DW52_9HYPH|nr:methyltransferase [Aureimonas fodinaquatilis]KAA0969419.1 class I SAM-dependent methyltransferase [Aureimonas fodinaquatilis]
MNKSFLPFPHAVYGTPPPDLVDLPDNAGQLSPLIPGSASLEALSDASLQSLCIAAPQGSLERRFVLGHGLRAVAPGGELTVLAPKDKGGSRLAGELQDFGCEVAETYKSRQRICRVVRPDAALPLKPAIQAGSPILLDGLGLWTQPGVFSWDRLDPGSAMLMALLPDLSGDGIDLGCGLGFLMRKALTSAKVTSIAGFDIDRRAVECASHNIVDERASFHWADARKHGMEKLDFVISNPPFHSDGVEQRSLGQDFIRAARAALRRGGVFWLVANRHLPYEAVLTKAFRKVEVRQDQNGYKLLEAIA